MSRFHHQWMPDKLYLEQGGYDINTIQDLIGMGHSVVERTHYGEVMAIEFLPDGMNMVGGADRRRGGGCAVGY
jgi:gamma-glutamyltranspeptidase/glutathione hydrolase